MQEFAFKIRQELHDNLLDYVLLFTAGVFFLSALAVYRGERIIEFILLCSFTSFYILWGLYHHAASRTLHFKTVIEYILIGFLAIFLLKVVILP